MSLNIVTGENNMSTITFGSTESITEITTIDLKKELEGTFSRKNIGDSIFYVYYEIYQPHASLGNSPVVWRKSEPFMFFWEAKEFADKKERKVLIKEVVIREGVVYENDNNKDI